MEFEEEKAQEMPYLYSWEREGKRRENVRGDRKYEERLCVCGIKNIQSNQKKVVYLSPQYNFGFMIWLQICTLNINRTE